MGVPCHTFIPVFFSLPLLLLQQAIGPRRRLARSTVTTLSAPQFDVVLLNVTETNVSCRIGSLGWLAVEVRTCTNYR